MGLLAELCRVVDERESPGPWLRRAVHETADALRRAPRIKTWHVERAAFGALMLGAVWVDLGDSLGLPVQPTGVFATLGLSPEAMGLASVLVLGLSLFATFDGAEGDSIAARKAEKDAAEGRAPTRVECSAREDVLSARAPWFALALLVYSFGAVGVVGFAWRLGYPLWRRWWRARYPLTKDGT